MIAPEFIAEFGSALQGLLPVGQRVVDPSAAIGAQRIWKTVDLDFGLSALGGPRHELHKGLRQLFGAPSRRLVEFRHHRLLLFFLLLHVAQFFGGLLRLALRHSALDVSGGKHAGPCWLRCAATFGHDFPPSCGCQPPTSARAWRAIIKFSSVFIT